MKPIASGLTATGAKNSDRSRCLDFTARFSPERERQADRIHEHDEADGKLDRVPERPSRRFVANNLAEVAQAEPRGAGARSSS